LNKISYNKKLFSSAVQLHPCYCTQEVHSEKNHCKRKKYMSLQNLRCQTKKSMMWLKAVLRCYSFMLTPNSTRKTMMMVRSLFIFSILSVLTIWRLELAKIYTQVDLSAYILNVQVIGAKIAVWQKYMFSAQLLMLGWCWLALIAMCSKHKRWIGITKDGSFSVAFFPSVLFLLLSLRLFLGSFLVAIYLFLYFYYLSIVL